MNVVFLDIDGVLNSLPYCDLVKEYQGYNEIDESKLPLLKKIVEDNEAVIVLSSTWRDLQDSDISSCIDMWDYLVNTLAKYGLEIMDSTPYVKGNRPLEIKAWIENYESVHNNKINWISLDDDFAEKDYEAAGVGGHLIKTEFFVKDITNGGLLIKHVELAKEMFEEQKTKGDMAYEIYKE